MDLSDLLTSKIVSWELKVPRNHEVAAKSSQFIVKSRNGYITFNISCHLEDSDDSQCLDEKSKYLNFRVNLQSGVIITGFGFVFSILGLREEILIKKKDMMSIEDWNNLVLKGQTYFGFSKFLKFEDIEKNPDLYCSDGILRFRVEFFDLTSTLFDTKGPSEESIQMSITEARENFQKVFDLSLQNSSLVKFICSDDYTVTISKTILTEQSKYFKKYFHSDEVTTYFAAFNHKVISEMLRFLGTQTVRNIEEVDIDLFEAAEKFNIKVLSEMCLKSMFSSVNYNNVFNIMDLAEAYELPGLFDRCCEVLQNFYLDFKTTDEWKSLKQKNKIYRRMINNFMASDKFVKVETLN